eukprot:scpid71614/ scgid15931/ 
MFYFVCRLMQDVQTVPAVPVFYFKLAAKLLGCSDYRVQNLFWGSLNPCVLNGEVSFVEVSAQGGSTSTTHHAQPSWKVYSTKEYKLWACTETIPVTHRSTAHTNYPHSRTGRPAVT